MASGWGKGGAYMGLAFVLPISMLVCFFIGDYLNKSWGGIVGILVGFAAGLYETMRQVNLLNRTPKK